MKTEPNSNAGSGCPATTCSALEAAPPPYWKDLLRSAGYVGLRFLALVALLVLIGAAAGAAAGAGAFWIVTREFTP